MSWPWISSKSKWSTPSSRSSLLSPSPPHFWRTLHRILNNSDRDEPSSWRKKTKTGSGTTAIVIRLLITAIHLQPFLAFFVLVLAFGTNGSTGVALAVALPQQRTTTTARPCTGFLCEYTQLNNEIVAAGGDTEKLAGIMKRLEALRERDRQEQQRREETRRREEERQREERQRQHERERQRWEQQAERDRQKRSKKNWETAKVVGGIIGGIAAFAGCCWCCAVMCKDDGTGTGAGAAGGAAGEGYQMGQATNGGVGGVGDHGHDYVAGGFIFPPGPTTATTNFTPPGGQPCTFTPLGAGEPLPSVAVVGNRSPNRSPSPRSPQRSGSPYYYGDIGGGGGGGPAASAPYAPPDYHDAVRMEDLNPNPPYNPTTYEEEQPDPKPGRKKRIPGPT